MGAYSVFVEPVGNGSKTQQLALFSRDSQMGKKSCCVSGYNENHCDVSVLNCWNVYNNIIY